MCLVFITFWLSWQYRLLHFTLSLQAPLLIFTGHWFYRLLSFSLQVHFFCWGHCLSYFHRSLSLQASIFVCFCFCPYPSFFRPRTNLRSFSSVIFLCVLNLPLGKCGCTCFGNLLCYFCLSDILTLSLSFPHPPFFSGSKWCVLFSS